MRDSGDQNQESIKDQIKLFVLSLDSYFLLLYKNYSALSAASVSAAASSAGASSSSATSSATGAFLAAIAAAFSSFFLASAAKAALRASSFADNKPAFLPVILPSFCSVHSANLAAACSSVKAPFLTPPSKCFL